MKFVRQQVEDNFVSGMLAPVLGSLEKSLPRVLGTAWQARAAPVL